MDSDEAAIAYFTDLAGDGVRIDYNTNGNPFRFKTDDEIFSDRQQTNQRLRLEHEGAKKFTLMQRTEMTRPHVPPCETRATIIHSALAKKQSPVTSLPKKARKESITHLDFKSASQNPFRLDTMIDSNILTPSLLNNKERFQSPKVRPSSAQSKRSTNSKIKPNTTKKDNLLAKEIITTQDTPGSLDLLPLSPISSPRTSNNETQDNKESENNKNKSPQPKQRERKLTMHEFVDEKREIYRLQLFIDKKNRDISKFSRNIETNDRKLQEAETKIKTLSDQYKMTTIQMEAAVARSRKLADAAARQTTLKKKELQKHRSSCEMLESEIIKKEALLESYQIYEQFLSIFIPENSSLEDHFTTPNILIDELEKIETDNLFIIQECDHIVDSLKVSTIPVEKKLESTMELNKEAIERLNSIEKVKPFEGNFTPAQEKLIDSMESELHHITELIKKTYSKCISQDTDLKPIRMLERIENKLENMYMLLVYVDTDFIAEKQAIKLRIRRDLQRQQKQERKELEQKMKMEQAIERAKKPIPQKVGRPINHRIIPIKAKIHDDEKIKAKLREIERERNLLYGEFE